MPFLRRDAASSHHSSSTPPSPRFFRRVNHNHRRAVLVSLFLLFVLLAQLLGDWSSAIPTASAATTSQFGSKPGHLTLQQYQQEGQPSKKNQGKFKRSTTHPSPLKSGASEKTDTPLPSAEPAKMKDQTYTLDDSFVLHRPKMASSTKAAKVTGTAIPAGSTSFQIKGSDGRLEVQLARGSLDFSQATLADGSAPVGQLLLQLHQLSGHYIAESSILGTYQIQIVDSQGNVVQGVKLLQPLTILYHYQDWEMQDLNLDPNAVHLTWADALFAAQAAKQPTSGLALPMTNDASAQTLTAQSMVIDGTLDVSGEPEIAAPAHPDLFEVNGNSGQYSYNYPISVAPGPDGFAPQLQLSYSSQSTNEHYNARAPAGDEGEGWSLSLGSITAAQYPDTSTGGARTWYSINGVGGVSDKLVPHPDNPVTYYETQHISHLHIEWTGSCWTVWDRDGTYYQLGCTPDSLQKTSSGTYEWDVNEILAPYNNHGQVKAMLISYLQDSPSSGTIRDSGIKQIQYGFATSAPASSLSQVVGTVDFHYHAPSSNGSWASAYGNNYHCDGAPPATTTLRCDDTVSTTLNGITVPAPTVMSTLTLDSITNYIGSDTSGQKAYSYAFSYDDTPYTDQHWDALTGDQEASAGELLLTKITPTVYLSGAAQQRAPVVFGYSSPLHDIYRDPTVQPRTGTDHYGGQTFWRYLNLYEDLHTGIGARISYATAYANMNGTPYLTDGDGNVTDDRFDPFYCDWNSCTDVYAHPEDFSWSMQVVLWIAALGTDSSGNTTVATTNYYYDLTAIPSNRTPAYCHPFTGTGVPAAEADCVGDSWVPGYNGTSTPDRDQDWADYYHSEFRGFGEVDITSPANNLTVDYYISTDGWWTPTSNATNYNSGQVYQEDVYQGVDGGADGALLRETYNFYTGMGSPYPNNSCDGNLSPIYTPCVATMLETASYFYDGTPRSEQDNVPWIDTVYTYDDVNADGGYAYNGAYHNLLQEEISGSNLPATVYPLTKKWQYAPTNGKWNNIFYYDVDKVSHSEIDDASGHVWACQDTTYDEGAPTGGAAPAAGLATTSTSYSTCGNASTALKTYTAYDQYGNVVATVDPLAAANPGLYGSHGCSATGVVDLSASWTAGRFTSCLTYDTTTAALPVSTQNAFGQTSSLNYDYTAGAQLNRTTDVNSQTTSFGYAWSNGNETITASEPGETAGSFTSKQTENSTCTTSSTLPCYEIDSSSSLYPNAIARTFYDSQGRATETRTPGPTPGDDTVVMTVYNDQNNSVWTSVPFQVASGSGWIDPTSAKDSNGNTPTGTVTFADALGRTIATQDPNWGSSQEPGLACSTLLTGKYTACTNYSFGQAIGDSTYYASTTSIDANGHVSQSFADASGQVRYTQQDSGVYGGTLTPIIQTQTQYNALNKPISVVVIDEQPQSGESPAAVTTTATYDDMGRLLSMTDPDQGTFAYSYDPDGHVLTVMQTSGSSSRTVGINYDLLGRVGCGQTAAPTINWNGACSAGNPLVQNTYDSTEIGTQGSTDFSIGRLTQSVATTYYPDSTSATTTYQFQYDQRGRAITAQMLLSVPTSWGVSAALPTAVLAQSYNDADQPTTTSTSADGFGYTFTQVYDSGNGALQGLSSNSSSTANLATVTYNANALLSQINFATSTGASGLATEQFGYDGDLRPTTTTATWASSSGQSGSLFNQTRTFDNAGNVTSLTTTQAQVQGQSSSGGTQTENYCYDEQNRLLWAGNSGTQPGAGNGTCGSGTLGNTLAGADYATGYTHTNLGQLWQAPVADQLSQYLYCDSNHPHRLSGIYPLGTTCSTTSSATARYTASYDAWGNETSRSYNGVTATLSYDALNHLVQWNGGSAGQEQYVYDASGQRVLKRSTNSGGTTNITVYAFGQELQYHADGTPLGGTNNTYYYDLGGMLIGKTDGTNTTFFITDGLGSVVSSFSNTAGSAAVLGNQSYEPYGTQQYQGNLGTNRGYTGQQNDNLSGLDYYGARYYDPVSAQFLSADNVQGNAQGMDPYSYVEGNPETFVDPTGEMLCPEATNADCGTIDVERGISAPSGGKGGMPSGGGGGIWSRIIKAAVAAAVIGVAVARAVNNPNQGDPFVGHHDAPEESPQSGDPFVGHHDNPTPGDLLGTPGAVFVPSVPWEGWNVNTDMFQDGSGGCSFTANTQVETPKGEQAIGSLHTGDTVMAYNPKTHKMEAEPVLHVWTNVDSDLIDLTVTVETPAHDGKPATKKTEVIHTTSEHPFLTTDQGFVAAGNLQVGMHIQSADGSIGTITGSQSVHATQPMYNLEVAQDHTFVVGDGEWVVHNRCERRKLRRDLGLQAFSFQAQHVVPCALETRTDAVGDFTRAAIRGGWLLNGTDNGLALPINAANAIRRHLPIHYALGNHDPYSNQVIRLIKNIIKGWGGIPPDPVAAQMMGQIASYLIIRTQVEGKRLTTPTNACTLNDIVI